MQRIQNISQHRADGGFTLVEMLVSVTLVLLMMTMFATVFQIATGSVSTQRANSENDQKARMLTTILRADFAKRTFRNLQPFVPGELSASSPTSFGNRTGYFYLSTNDPSSAFDDLVQFTINAGEVSENADSTDYFGQAIQVVDPVNGGTSLSASPNQPELDDGQLNANQTGSSPFAEVCYFIRNGSLYRRQLLIREPIGVAGGDLETQPTSFRGVDFFAGYTDNTDDASRESTFTGNFITPFGATNDFYEYFDYSAYPTFPNYNGTTFQQATFLSSAALNNEEVGVGPVVAFGKPWYRFGFDVSDGLSREHLALNGAVATGFMGRFLHAETSTPNFQYPQQPAQNEAGALLPGGGNPLNIDSVQYSLNKHGIISTFDNATSPDVGRGGTRSQEDLLLANVHEFRIELWDERFGNFVAPGHGETADAGLNVGDFHISRFNPFSTGGGFGPDNRITGAVFDTWHPDMTGLTSHALQRAPYQLYETIYPPSVPNGPSTASTGVSISAAGSGTSVSYWAPSTQYVVGDIVFPRWEQIIVDSGTMGTVNEFDPGIDSIQGQGYQFYYRCVAISELDPGEGGDPTESDPGESSPTPAPNGPSWPTTHGRRFTENEVTWQCFDNRRSLKAARIKIRFKNQKSGGMRQLTLVLPLADET